MKHKRTTIYIPEDLHNEVTTKFTGNQNFSKLVVKLLNKHAGKGEETFEELFWHFYLNANTKNRKKLLECKEFIITNRNLDSDNKWNTWEEPEKNKTPLSPNKLLDKIWPDFIVLNKDRDNLELLTDNLLSGHQLAESLNAYHIPYYKNRIILPSNLEMYYLVYLQEIHICTGDKIPK